MAVVAARDGVAILYLVNLYAACCYGDDKPCGAQPGDATAGGVTQGADLVGAAAVAAIALP